MQEWLARRAARSAVVPVTTPHLARPLDRPPRARTASACSPTRCCGGASPHLRRHAPPAAPPAGSTPCSSRTCTATTSTCRRCADCRRRAGVVPARRGDALRSGSSASRSSWRRRRAAGRRRDRARGRGRPRRPAPPAGAPTETVGYVIEAQRRVYFAGDTERFDGDGRARADRRRADARSGAGARRSAPAHGPRAGRGGRRAAAPRLAVPIHWGTYLPITLGQRRGDLLVDPPHRFAARCAELAPDTRVSMFFPARRLT